MKEKIRQLLDGIGITLQVAFGFQRKRKVPKDPMEQACTACGFKRKDHGAWRHEFEERPIKM